MLLEDGEDLLQVLHLLLMCAASYQHVIQVHKDKREATQYIVHQPLEGLACVAEAKWHPDELEEAI